MDRQRAKELWPIMQAFAEGKTIQSRYIKGSKLFSDNTNPSFSDGFEYRTKPEPNYRPFANQEECWNEMLKHQPFGWVKAYHGQFFITGLKIDRISFGINDNFHSYNYMFKEYTFADGTPFGIKE